MQYRKPVGCGPSLKTCPRCASQALHVTQRTAPPALRQLLADVRRHVPPVDESRAIAPDMEQLAAALRSGIHEPARQAAQ